MAKPPLAPPLHDSDRAVEWLPHRPDPPLRATWHLPHVTLLSITNMVVKDEVTLDHLPNLTPRISVRSSYVQSLYISVFVINKIGFYDQIKFNVIIFFTFFIINRSTRVINFLAIYKNK